MKRALTIVKRMLALLFAAHEAAKAAPGVAYVPFTAELDSCRDTAAEREADKCGQLARFEASGEWVAESKADGNWGEIKVRRTSDEVVIRTRTGRRKRIPELERHILDSDIPDHTMLIVELGCGTQTAQDERRRLGHPFCDVLDVVRWDGHDIAGRPRDERRAFLLERLGSAEALTDWIRPIREYREKFAAAYRAEDEGIVLKRRTGTYFDAEQIKAKHVFDADLVAMNVVRSEKHPGRAASIVCGAFKAGELVQVVKACGLPRDLAEDLVANWGHYAGAVVTVEHSGRTRGGSLRHPRLRTWLAANDTQCVRTDKRPEECTV